MSVLIKGMEMPKSCYNCFVPCDVLPLGYHKLDEFREQRYEECPLTEVPTPHGRLIDAHKLLTHKTDHEMISTHQVWNAPTVIESEE